MFPKNDTREPLVLPDRFIELRPKDEFGIVPFTFLFVTDIRKVPVAVFFDRAILFVFDTPVR